MELAFQKELTCVICLNYLIDPVTIDCGHSFCRACLCLSWEDTRTPLHSPLCREISKQTKFRTNTIVKNLVSLVRQASLRKFLSSEDQMCGVHKETKNVFCEECKNLLCLLCCTSPEQKAHRHCFVECAVEEYWEKLLKQMRSLWEKTQENQRNLTKERKIAEEWDYVMFIRTYLIKMQYQKLHPLPPEEEKQHLEGLEHEGKRIFHQLKESEAAMVQKRKHLREMYEELMSISHKTDVEMLQDLGDILARSESLQLRMPQPVNPVLSARPITGLIERFNQFSVEISFSSQRSTQNLMLFGEVRSWWRRHELQEVPFPSGRANYSSTWGAQVFTSGKHCWEIDVEDFWEWAVGVCNKDSWRREHFSVTESEDIILLLCLKENNHYHLFTNSPLLSLYIEKLLGQVGVFVDLESAIVSFVNVAKSSLIESRLIPFRCPLRPFFCTGHT